ncbi:metal ABC transporter permease [Dongia rigui]|uniref:Metal ABC transporter permease n=1 Tax=Dongia rigui TaxID=940149 RepID=A0ABU5E2S8_9PROT|nr:metal ABC transporter permease [Dongia rigui]MDY0873846.1 metal ABC transporter permease [Dongia rigui]
MLTELLLTPFVDFAFMRRALVAVIAVSLVAGPLGVFLQLRRMSLMGDALAHAILPGVAIGFFLFGLDLWAMSVGGLVACLAVALLSGAIARLTALKEDTSLAALYLVSLASGVLIVSLRGNTRDLLHILFGSLLSIGGDALVLVVVVAVLSLVVFAVIYRTLVVECFDPMFLRAVGGRGAAAHMAFLVLIAVNLVAAIQALGTLMAVGLMILPAAAARFWAGSVAGMIALSSGIALVAGVVGLLGSYHADLPPGPAIVLVAGLVYLASVIFGRIGGLARRLFPGAHLQH